MPFPDYEVIITIGPATPTQVEWEKLAASGASGFRLNTSHLSLPQLETWLKLLQPFLAHTHFPLTLDLQGSKWRLGDFTPFDLQNNATVTLIHADRTDQPDKLPVPHVDFFEAALQFPSVSSTGSSRNPEILLNDAKIKLQLRTASKDRIAARILQGGVISPKKGITFVASDFRKESMNEKDKAIVQMTRSDPSIRYAISYVKDAIEMGRYRALFGETAYLIAKIERQTALDDALEIAHIADEVWLCRGDLGAELGLVALAEKVYNFSSTIARFTKPVFMAGQVLEHMIEHFTPTRSEICFLYETLLRGYQGVVLSDETAIGQYPVESCRTAAIFKNENLPITTSGD